MIELCYDIVNEILSHCDSKTTASLFSTNRHLYEQSKNNKVMILRKQLAHNLRKTEPDIKKFYNSHILNLKIGDRISDSIHNYKVYFVAKKFALLEVVDLYGNKIDNNLILTNICNIKKLHPHVKNNNLYWATYHYDVENELPVVLKLKYGIIKHRFGPAIKNVDSLYLLYKTTEQNPFKIYYDDDLGTPELDMFVTVIYKWKLYEYIIKELKSQSMVIQYNGQDDVVEKQLEVINKDNQWVIQNKKYKIAMFGGYVDF